MKKEMEMEMSRKSIYLLGAVMSVTAIGAHAQSSVTLYGIVSANVTYVNNTQSAAVGPGGKPVGGARYAQLDGAQTGVTGSRWGLRGAEDLGGGLKAIFNLENGFSLANGTSYQGGALWGRLAYVGLSSPVGTVTLGRQSDTNVDFVGPLSYAWTWGYFNTHPSDFDNLDFTNRTNNSVKYTSPSMGGFTVGAMYSFGGVAGDVSRNQVWSVGGGYANGPLSLGASILNARDPNFSFYGTAAGASTTGNNMGSFGSTGAAQLNPLIAGFASARTAQLIAAGGAYSIGNAKIGLVYTNTQYKNLGSLGGSLNPLGYSGTATFNNAEASLTYFIMPDLRVGLAYDYTHRDSVGKSSSASYHQVNAGIDYFLSKATDVYVAGAFQHASGTDSLGQSAVATLDGLSPSTTNKQLAVVMGVKHLF